MTQCLRLSIHPHNPYCSQIIMQKNPPFLPFPEIAKKTLCLDLIYCGKGTLSWLPRITNSWLLSPGKSQTDWKKVSFVSMRIILFRNTFCLLQNNYRIMMIHLLLPRVFLSFQLLPVSSHLCRNTF